MGKINKIFYKKINPKSLKSLSIGNKENIDRLSINISGIAYHTNEKSNSKKFTSFQKKNWEFRPSELESKSPINRVINFDVRIDWNNVPINNQSDILIPDKPLFSEPHKRGNRTILAKEMPRFGDRIDQD